MSNPFGAITGEFSNIFAGNKAFAAGPIDDPFGVIQMGYPSIPSDPETYWDQHCQGDFTTPWLNSQQQDPNTGEPVPTSTNPCLLIQGFMQSAGASLDTSLLPASSLNADPTGP
jgi:hypothetical protein